MGGRRQVLHQRAGLLLPNAHLPHKISNHPCVPGLVATAAVDSVAASGGMMRIAEVHAHRAVRVEAVTHGAQRGQRRVADPAELVESAAIATSSISSRALPLFICLISSSL